MAPRRGRFIWQRAARRVAHGTEHEPRVAAHAQDVMPLRVFVRSRRSIFWASLFLVLSGFSNPRIEKTVDKNAVGTVSYLNVHVISLSLNSDQVAFETDGEIGVRDSSGTWQNKFILVKGQKFWSQPDHHASSSFEVVNISTDSVSLKYVSQFNHASFGKNLINMDESEIKIPFKETN
jgi:hypothetical protein